LAALQARRVPDGEEWGLSAVGRRAWVFHLAASAVGRRVPDGAQWGLWAVGRRACLAGGPHCEWGLSGLRRVAHCVLEAKRSEKWKRSLQSTSQRLT